MCLWRSVLSKEFISLRCLSSCMRQRCPPPWPCCPFLTPALSWVLILETAAHGSIPRRERALPFLVKSMSFNKCWHVMCAWELYFCFQSFWYSLEWFFFACSARVFPLLSHALSASTEWVRAGDAPSGLLTVRRGGDLSWACGTPAQLRQRPPRRTRSSRSPWPLWPGGPAHRQPDHRRAVSFLLPHGEFFESYTVWFKIESVYLLRDPNCRPSPYSPGFLKRTKQTGRERTPSACHRSVLFSRKSGLFFSYKSTTGTKVKE